MTAKIAVRWRPQAYRSTIETIDTASSGTNAGDRIETLQVVVYDDTQLATPGNPYVPGSPATEQFLRVVTETPISLGVDAFVGKTYAESKALWDAARDNQIAAWQGDPKIQARINAAVGAGLSTFVLIG